ncbi:bifunctional 3-(3-hydroxy-phenyl)propionate/3-hydroxycinnamic acid hydroxylase MhpA [Streptomyces purpureus]|uniref:3-(3-hydroxyphenyl)propionate hydroxylase n=1 Tax=Streptomyces purpureus TaxID=1951 RepID=A0A918LX78_9ACTN|nr:bifunctional 3-(3-hydroxy-phenyl)propionate/3-hydroxycinnamic acid hydroxylase [Streptomyces purpureus]GGT63091.1 3-(3-hydroxyphenyl)propionate hydroxylase [Streptomyces purpureus]
MYDTHAEPGGDSEVLVVGYGPVGQTLSVLLAQRGHRVTVVERWPKAYAMPRAVNFDSESARILAAAGLAEQIPSFSEPSGAYEWLNAEGRTLLRIEATEEGRCGWPDSTAMYQPGLEAALAARGAQLPRLTVLRGLEGVALDVTGDRVRLTVRPTEGGDGERVLTASWIVGCDGANSFVRGVMGVGQTDQGFSHDWLICDVAPHERRVYEPNNLQVCDPARPRTHVSAGPGHRRWEFMRVPGETVEELNTEERAWELLAEQGITPDDAVMERHALYTFNARCTDEWRTGRMLLAGDAAHLMPPFAAQGMCSGFRDAANLAWKLDLVLSGRASEAVLDSYTVERRQHVQHAIGMSVNLGKVICQDDPVAAAERDAVMLAARERGVGTAQPKGAVQPLKDGLLYRRSAGRAPRRPAGDLMPQGRVERDGLTGLFDEVVGLGFVLLTADDPAGLLGDEDRAFLDGLGARVVRVVPVGTQAGPGEVVDTDGVYLTYLAESRTRAVLVRPDFYVYGPAADRAELASVLGQLREGLGVLAAV